MNLNSKFAPLSAALRSQSRRPRVPAEQESAKSAFPGITWTSAQGIVPLIAVTTIGELGGVRQMHFKGRSSSNSLIFAALPKGLTVRLRNRRQLIKEPFIRSTEQLVFFHRVQLWIAID